MSMSRFEELRNQANQMRGQLASLDPNLTSIPGDYGDEFVAPKVRATAPDPLFGQTMIEVTVPHMDGVWMMSVDDADELARNLLLAVELSRPRKAA